MAGNRNRIKETIMRYIALLLLASCTPYEGVVVVKGCCPSYLELIVKKNHYVIPGNPLYWFDSLNIGDTALIDRNTLRIIKKI